MINFRQLFSFLDKSKGFTLAEVLITLGIIGIIAAMTIPNLVTNYQKKATIIQLKKFYAVMTNAVRASEKDNDGSTGWDLSLTPEEFYKQYLRDYLQISSECGPTRGRKCTTISNRVDLKNTTAPLDFINRNRAFGFVLNNGIMVWMNKYENQGPIILLAVDLNGDSKPNRNGRDIFGFVFTKDGFHGYSHYGWKHNWRYDSTGAYGSCHRQSCCSWMGAGGACSQMIIQDNWQMRSDYPW